MTHKKVARYNLAHYGGPMNEDQVKTLSLMASRGAEIAALSEQIARLAERQASDAARLLKDEALRLREDR